MLICLAAPLAVRAEPYAGRVEASLFDSQYPDMADWARAGWHPPASLPTAKVLQLHPGDDLTAAVSEPNRRVQLAAGTYELKATLNFADNVVLRGAGPGLTKLVVRLRGTVPTRHDDRGFSTWITGLLLKSVKNSGIENLTVMYDDTLPLPPDPRRGKPAYINDPDGKNDLHVALVRLTDCQNCWLSDGELLNAGDHPLIVEASRHVTVENTDIAGTYNKAGLSGTVSVTGSEYCLFNSVQMRDINHFVLHEGSTDHPCRYNVIVNSRINVDVRFRDADSGHNLLQDCVIAVPSWHDFPPISQGSPTNQERPPGSGNLIYLCTITRDFSSGGRSFSVADNPNRVYRVLDHFSLGATVEEAGPAPNNITLWAVH